MTSPLAFTGQIIPNLNLKLPDFFFLFFFTDFVFFLPIFPIFPLFSLSPLIFLYFPYFPYFPYLFPISLLMRRGMLLDATPPPPPFFYSMGAWCSLSPLQNFCWLFICIAYQHWQMIVKYNLFISNCIIITLNFEPIRLAVWIFRNTYFRWEQLFFIYEASFHSVIEKRLYPDTPNISRLITFHWTVNVF